MSEAVDNAIRETFLAGQFLVLARPSGVSHSRQTQAGTKLRQQVTNGYVVNGEKLCQAVYIFANCCTRHMLQKVQPHLEAGFIVTPPHNRSGARPWSVHSDDENQFATQFIQNYADVHLLPQPAALRGHNRPAPIYLTCHKLKR